MTTLTTIPIEERAEERERGRGNSVKQDNDHVQCQNQCQSVCKNEMAKPGQPPNQEHNARPGFLEARHLSRYMGSESERLANYLEATQNATINENQTVIFSSPYSSHSCYASRTQGDKVWQRASGQTSHFQIVRLVILDVVAWLNSYEKRLWHKQRRTKGRLGVGGEGDVSWGKKGMRCRRTLGCFCH